MLEQPLADTLGQLEVDANGMDVTDAEGDGDGVTLAHLDTELLPLPEREGLTELLTLALLPMLREERAERVRATVKLEVPVTLSDLLATAERLTLPVRDVVAVEHCDTLVLDEAEAEGEELSLAVPQTEPLRVLRTLLVTLSVYDPVVSPEKLRLPVAQAE